VFCERSLYVKKGVANPWCIGPCQSQVPLVLHRKPCICYNFLTKVPYDRPAKGLLLLFYNLLVKLTVVIKTNLGFTSVLTYDYLSFSPTKNVTSYLSQGAF